MQTEIITPKDKNHWLELRLRDITSTEISALFGISPYTTEFELWHTKKNAEIVEFEESERMKWGTLLQDTIAKGIAEQEGWSIRRMDEYIRGTDTRIGSSFDFEITDNAEYTGLLEIKNVDSFIFKNNWVENEEGEIEAPLHIEIQVQHQLAVSGMPYVYIGVLVGGNTLHLLPRERNENVIDSIISKVNKFWESIENNTPPEPNFEKDSDFIAKLYGYADDEKIIDVKNDDGILSTALRYKNASEEIKKWEGVKKACKAELLINIGDAKKAIGDEFSISAGVVKDSRIEAYTRKGYRSLRINWRKKK